MPIKSVSNWGVYFLKPLPYLLGLAVGLSLGILATLSLLRTVWETFKPDFFFWSSIIMTVISLILVGFSIWQYLSVQSEKKKGDAQVKIWMQSAQGLDTALRTISVNTMNHASTRQYSSVNDVGMAIFALAENAQALYQSLYEERCVTEEEYTTQQREIGNAMHKKRLNDIENQPTSTSKH
jgi:high-affinity Fe2+/Pb2+ permease